jgi:hypothetical protein
VEGHPVVMEGEETLEERLEGLEKRFCLVHHDPLMVKIKEIYKRVIVRTLEE